ncbi:MAG: hypothetical protein M1831_006627 [Alyxoria varia]|nr:MAG: hypothetical protein M1831_006627 [Alyxoria varia]
MAEKQLTSSILVISDTASKDPLTDKSSRSLTQVFESNDWTTADTKIVPDDVLRIQSAITQWTDNESSMNLIVTTGGTGFAVQDHTPEAVAPLLHKQAPGLVHGMLAASLNVTPFAMMSRPVAGVRHKTLILTLPGSPKGATENLEAVIKLLPHACQQASGADSRAMHAGGVEKLEAQSGVGAGAPGHHHHHHAHAHGSHNIPKPHTAISDRPQSSDPAAGPSQRNRSSPYSIMSVKEALALIEQNAPVQGAEDREVHTDLVGHVLAQDTRAREAVPAFRASIVDGYANACTSASKTNQKGVFTVAFAVHAQQTGESLPSLPRGRIARITTGAPLPEGADAVVMVEDTTVKAKTDDGTEETEVEILTDQVKTGENVREIGSDVKSGDIIMRAGEGISEIGGEVGLLASAGIQSVSTFKKPVVGVLSTGDELVPHDRPKALKLGEVRDTNRPTLLSAVRGTGFKVVDMGIASDKSVDLEESLRSALMQTDVLITTGGVSMGELDLLKPTIERKLGGTIHFGRVSMKPGKPTTFATVPSENFKDPNTGSRHAETKPKGIFSLPGNPASAITTFMLFVLPALHQMSGIKPVGLPRVSITLDSDVQCDNSRQEYHRVVLQASRDGLIHATSTGGQRSSRIGSFQAANGLVELPAGGGLIRKGSKAEALVMGGIGGIGK